MNPYKNDLLQDKKKEKILLALLPYWYPLMPLLGLCSIKSYLERHGYIVKVLDLNSETLFRRIYDKYFDTLLNFFPENKKVKGNDYYNIGHNVLQNHMMAYINHTNEKKYFELVKIIIFKTFYFEANDALVKALNEILDEFYFTFEEYLMELLEKEKPDVVGFSLYTHTLPTSIHALKLIRSKYSQTRTVAGGGIFSQTLDVKSPDFEYFLQKTEPYLDKIIIGEGEELFLKYLQGELPDSQRVYSKNDIGNKLFDIASNRPDFSDFDLRLYIYLPAYGSRSCPYRCKFCSEPVYWGAFRRKKAYQLAEEMKELSQRYNKQLFWMCDCLLDPIIMDMSNELLKFHRSIYWDGNLRVSNMACNIENTLLWRRAGFYKARLGLESGSQRLLDHMGKRTTVQQIKDTLSSLTYAGIKTTTYWIIGFPGETREDFQETLNLIEEIKDDIYEAQCEPFYYFPTGQVNSDQWLKENNTMPLYPESERDTLITRTWILDTPPSREETYERIKIFVNHCTKLGIPNAQYLTEIYDADKRWKKLHKNAVPAVIEFVSDSYIDENKKIKQLALVENTLPTQDKGDFNFTA